MTQHKSASASAHANLSRRRFLQSTSIISTALLPGISLAANSSVADNVKALTFDVFGTVVDWRASIIREGQLPWMKIDDLHRMILDDLVIEYGLEGMTAKELDDFNRAWHRLSPWPDTVAGLNRLKTKYVITTLSNGNVSLLTNMAKNAGMPWDAILSAELSGHYKPDPEAYLKAADLLSLAPEQVMMVAAHPGDLRGAARAGLRTAYVIRPLERGPGRPVNRNPDGEFDYTADSCLDLAKQLGA